MNDVVGALQRWSACARRRGEDTSRFELALWSRIATPLAAVVMVFLAIPVLSALAGDPQRFLERNAKIQWGIMVCVFGLSHAPALLLLEFPGYEGRGAFLVFFLVMVATVAQEWQQMMGVQAWMWGLFRQHGVLFPRTAPPEFAYA